VLGSQRLALPAAVLAARPGLARYTDREVIVGIRPEHLSSEPGDRPGLQVMVGFVEMPGSERLVHFTIDAPRVREESELREQAAAGTDQGEIVAASVAQSVARADPWAPIRAREKVTFGVDVARLHFFDPETGDAITAAAAPAAPVPQTA
jgi:multiple sugar transport system ATP-binding protein